MNQSRRTGQDLGADGGMTVGLLAQPVALLTASPSMYEVAARLALWLAVVSAEAAFAPDRRLEESEDATYQEPSPE